MSIVLRNIVPSVLGPPAFLSELRSTNHATDTYGICFYFANIKKYLDAYANAYPISKDELLRGLKLFYLKSTLFEKQQPRSLLLYPDFLRIKFLSENLYVIEDILTQ